MKASVLPGLFRFSDLDSRRVRGFCDDMNASRRVRSAPMTSSISIFSAPSRGGLSMFLIVSCLVGCPEDRAARAEKQLADLKTKQEELKMAKLQGTLVAPVETAKLDPPYDDSSSERLVPDGACPEGIWALFPGEAPGATPDEKKANAARRADVAKTLQGKQFMFRLRAPNQVVLKPHDAVAGVLPIEVLGTVDCTDAAGRVAIAWTSAKAGAPNASAAKEGSDLVQNLWLAPPVTFSLPIKSMSEAKTFMQNNALGLTARVVFTFGKGEVDKKLKNIPKVQEKAAGETLAFGGGTEDWGAGRLVRAELVGLRVAIELFEVKGTRKP
jgi:hypothetical protein